MSHASYNNQARVHNGYHYPRSVLTALRSRASFPKFVKEFASCIYSEFEQYYAVGKILSKVTAFQFNKFCKRIGAEIEPAPFKIKNLFNPSYISDCFVTREFAFDALKLRDLMLERISDFKIDIITGSEVIKVSENPCKTNLIATIRDASGNLTSCEGQQVFNCSYSRINFLNGNSGFEIIPLKHEMAEMCLVQVPDELLNVGITVMCGPFFSLMPFPSVLSPQGIPVHSFSHVRYTPHYEWFDTALTKYVDPREKLEMDEHHSAFEYMKRDAERYMPVSADLKYLSSLWEVKTVLPRSEVDDSRPILCHFNHGLKGYHCIMGGKIDNVYDAVAAIEKELKL